MKIMFKCAMCGSPVEYDLVSVEKHERRAWGVHRYVCQQPCLTCSVPEELSDSFAFETPEACAQVAR